jgi:hypothetical protein
LKVTQFSQQEFVDSSGHTPGIEAKATAAGGKLSRSKYREELSRRMKILAAKNQGVQSACDLQGKSLSPE